MEDPAERRALALEANRKHWKAGELERRVRMLANGHARRMDEDALTDWAGG